MHVTVEMRKENTNRRRHFDRALFSFSCRGAGRRKVRMVDSEKCVFDGTIVLTAFFCCCCSKRTYTQNIHSLTLSVCSSKNRPRYSRTGECRVFHRPVVEWISMSEIYQKRRKLNDDSRMRNVVVCRARCSLAIHFFFLAAQKQNNELGERKEFMSHVNIVPCRHRLSNSRRAVDEMALRILFNFPRN